MKVKYSYTPVTGAASVTHFQSAECDFSQLHEVTKEFNYSNIIWKDGKRKKDNFISANFVVLDVDGTWPIGEAMGTFKDTDNVLFVSSKSHQSPNKIKENGAIGDAIPPADYYHIIIGLEEPITDIEIYLTVMKNLTNQYPVDKSCKDGGRFYFPNQAQHHKYLNLKGANHEFAFQSR